MLWRGLPAPGHRAFGVAPSAVGTAGVRDAAQHARDRDELFAIEAAVDSDELPFGVRIEREQQPHVDVLRPQGRPVSASSEGACVVVGVVGGVSRYQGLFRRSPCPAEALVLTAAAAAAEAAAAASEAACDSHAAGGEARWLACLLSDRA